MTGSPTTRCVPRDCPSSYLSRSAVEWTSTARASLHGHVAVPPHTPLPYLLHERWPNHRRARDVRKSKRRTVPAAPLAKLPHCVLQVIAETVASLLDEKSRMLFVMIYIITRHQRYMQAGIEQLAAVAEYWATLIGRDSKQFDWELPRDGEAPFVPTRPVRHPQAAAFSFCRGSSRVVQLAQLVSP